MSTDPTKPMRAPAPVPDEPEADAPAATPPTVRAPAVKGPGAPAQPAAPGGQEPPTRAVPKWQAPPPPPAPPGGQRAPQGPQGRAQPAPATRVQPPPPPANPAPPTQWERPQQRPQSQQRQPPPPQPGQQPQPWTEPQPWAEPRDGRQDQHDDRQGQGQWPPPQAPGQWAQPPQPPASQPPEQQPRFRRGQRKRRVRRSVMALFTVIVLLILFVIGDRVALAVTENEMASSFQQNGLPVKPSVTIEGFPFLTQLLAKDFNKVDISASNVPVSLPTGGTLSITSIKGTINGLHISSYSSTASARVDHMTATGFVSFSALAAAGGIGDGTGVTFSLVNANTVKVTASLAGLVSDSEDVQITTTGPQTISVKALSSGSGDILGSVLSSLGSYSFSLPKGLPPSLKITNLSFSSQGVNIAASATNATFSQ
jgi:LmeA-like phospholipid-binding